MNNSRFVVGTHIIVALAGKAVVCGHYGKRPVASSDELAFSVNTNPVVVRRLLSLLQKAGLVETQSGRYGGTQLAKSAAQITLRDVYEAVEDGSIFHSHYQGPNLGCPIGGSIELVMEKPMLLAETSMKEQLAQCTIESLVDEILAMHNIEEKINAGMTYEELKSELEEQASTSISAL